MFEFHLEMSIQNIHCDCRHKHSCNVIKSIFFFVLLPYHFQGHSTEHTTIVTLKFCKYFNLCLTSTNSLDLYQFKFHPFSFLSPNLFPIGGNEIRLQTSVWVIYVTDKIVFSILLLFLLGQGLPWWRW